MHSDRAVLLEPSGKIPDLKKIFAVAARELLNMNGELPHGSRQKFLWHLAEATQVKISLSIADKNPQQLASLQMIFTKSVEGLLSMRHSLPAGYHEQFDSHICQMVMAELALAQEYSRAHKLGPLKIPSVINRTNEPT
ncbi:MAG TPA: hypothetical protein DCM27_07155 [Rhodospirillaceae bacterium]|nr:hypothetical protein [Rhodospirillaceae bacterium]